MATTRERLQEVIGRLKENDAAEVLDYAEWLLSDEDTEPLSHRERADLAEAEAERAEGGGNDWAKVKRDLGL